MNNEQGMVYFAALYISELWYGGWSERKRISDKARAMVVFDRVMAGRRSGDLHV